MLGLIPLLPLLGFLLNAAFGRNWRRSVSASVGCLAVFASFAVSVRAVRLLLQLPPEGRTIQQNVYTWIASGDFQIPLSLRLDPLGAVMILVVTGVGFLIHVYSVAYMAEERHAEFARYFSYLNLFAAFMLLLVLAANFVVMFVGWEGVGLCSYLLIGFWYGRPSAADAGKKAFIVNRIGDYGFLIALFAAFTQFGTLDFQDIARAAARLAPESSFGALSFIALLLFVGAIGKSAQIPLHVWLPDAMEGPTPVSALIHAATMVTAGVYMVARNAVLFSHAPGVLTLVAAVGAATAFFAATIGMVQHDIKRVLAYSTISQLGYMFLALGLGAYAAGIFHLYTHAFFKALLFLAAGAVIHALAGEQDLRRMGGLRRELPLTYWTFLIGAIAIAGVPGFAGFFSKDEILSRAFLAAPGLWLIGMVTSLLTAIYMFRVVFLAFHGQRRIDETAISEGTPAVPAHPEEQEPLLEETETARPPASDGRSVHVPVPGPGSTRPPRLHDASPAMAIPLVLLAVGAILAGYIGLPPALGGQNRFEHFLAPSFTVTTPDDVEMTAGRAGESVSQGSEGILMALSTAVAFAGIALAALLFLWRRTAAAALADRMPRLYRLLVRKYYVDEIYDAAIVQPIRIVAEDGLWRRVDARLIDGTVNGTAALVAGGSNLLRRVQTGSVRAYAASVFLGVVLVLGYYLWR